MNQRKKERKGKNMCLDIFWSYVFLASQAKKETYTYPIDY